MSSTPNKTKSHIKRPMNSFMVWSREKRCEILKKHPGINNAVVSKTLGAAWKSLTEEEKQPYVYEAQKLAEQHRDEHPEYKYRPRRKKSRAKTMKSAEDLPVMQVSPTHNPANVPCMCHTQKTPAEYRSPPRHPHQLVAPGPYPYPHPFYEYPPPMCCPHDVHPYREKAAFGALIERQEAIHRSAGYYPREHEGKWAEVYKPLCTLGCCSPTEEYMRYMRYTSVAKEISPR